MRVFALRPYHPSARRVYQPAALPERELLGFTDDDLARIAASGALA
jgi:hypothetical protein